MKEKKKMNSYVKIFLWMAFGGVIGGVLGIGTVFAEDGMKAMAESVSLWIGQHTFWIACIMAGVSLIIYIVCYAKGNGIIKKCQEELDDNVQEQLDEKYDFWQTVGTITSNGTYIVSMMMFCFSFQLDSKGEAQNLLYTTIPFAVCIIATAIYQIALVKQVKRKDPSKNGDAADMNFEKVWMKSCDEAEKRIIYQASYKTFRVVKIILLVALVIAMMGQLYFGTGMAAVILIGICNIAGMTLYSIFALKIQRAPMDA